MVMNRSSPACSNRTHFWRIVGVLLLAAGIIFLRKPDRFYAPQLLAEDGVVFFSGAYEHGWHSLLIPYGGYLHLLLRLVALLADSLDPLWVPAIYNYSAIFLNLAAIGLIFSPRVHLPAKPMLGLAVVLVPHTGEVYAHLTNMQWSLALILVLLLLSDDAHGFGQWLLNVSVVIIGGLTGPFLLFFAPLFIARAWWRRTRASWILLGLAGATALIQFVILFQNRGAFARSDPSQVRWLLSIMGARLYGSLIMGFHWLLISPHIGWLVLGGLCTLLWLYFGLRAGEEAYERRVLVIAGCCVIFPVMARFFHDTVSLTAMDNGDRYFYVPRVVLIWLIVVVAARARDWQRWTIAICLTIGLVMNLSSIQREPLKQYPWKLHVAEMRAGLPLHVPTNPEGWEIITGPRHSVPPAQAR